MQELEEELLKTLIKRTDDLGFLDYVEADDIKRKAEMLLKRLLPSRNYHLDVQTIPIDSPFIGIYSPQGIRKEWIQATFKLRNILHTAMQEYQLNKVNQEQPKEIVQVPIEVQVKVVDKESEEAIRKEYKNYKINCLNWLGFGSLSIVSSAILWLFYSFTNWEWFNQHEKNIPITFGINITLILALLNIPIRKNWLIIFTLIIAGIYSIINII